MPKVWRMVQPIETGCGTNGGKDTRKPAGSKPGCSMGQNRYGASELPEEQIDADMLGWSASWRTFCVYKIVWMHALSTTLPGIPR